MADEPLIDVAPAVLSKPAFAAIGRIVRACADLEDVLNLWICKLSGITEAQSTALLGRSPISTKLAIAEGLAKLCREGEIELHKLVFDSNMTRLLGCRNAVAHGTLVGKTKQGRYVFRTAHTLGYDRDSVAVRAEAYDTKTLAAIARISENRIAAMSGVLGLGSLRRRRNWRRLPEHRAGQQKRKPSPKPRRQQKPSPK
jgi:hypothetical protein